MELERFFKVLYRHKFTLIIIPLLTVALTYYLVRSLPDNYTSETQIATGLVDQTQTLSTNANATSQGEISQDFDNLVQITRSNKIINQVSYLLMIHDLTDPNPYERPSKLLLQLNASARKHALEVYTDCYNNRRELSLYNPDQNGLHTLLMSMGYDSESLLKELTVYRAETSDFINIDYTGDNPQLTAFVVNTLAREFITYYTQVVKENQRKAIAFLANLLQQKKDTLDVKTNKLKNYKIQNQIIDISEESGAIYSQIADFQTHLEQAQRDAVSTQAAIKSIDNQFKPTDRKYLASLSVPLNQSIVNITEQIKSLNQQYVGSNFNIIYKNKIDSLQRIADERISQSSDKNLVNPTATQQNLVQERLTLQVQYDLAKNSIGSIQSGLSQLNDKLKNIVPHEAVVEQDQSAIDIAQKEYLDILAKYNQTSLDASYTGQLKQAEIAMPGVAEPSKKIVLVVLSGIVSFAFCVMVLFLLYFFDDTIKEPGELANKTGMPVLGDMKLLPGKTVDLQKTWNEHNTDAQTYQFKNSLQSIRYEVDADLAGQKILVINSLTDGEGKTFIATNLAYAYSMVNKKVLLIDGNFHNPGISQSVKSNLYFEDYLDGNLPHFMLQNPSKISVLSNKGGDGSLFEISDEKTIGERLNKLKEKFDVIIVEASSLSTLNKSKEWNKFADKILTVFESGNPMKEQQKNNTEYLKSLDKKFMGWVLNVVNKHTNKAGYEYDSGL